MTDGPGIGTRAHDIVPFARAFDACAEMMVICDAADGTLLHVNDRWVETFGVSREEAVGRLASTLGLYEDPSDRDRLRARYEREGRLRDVEARLRSRATGRALVAMVSVEPLGAGTAGRPLLLVSLRDVTERARLLAAEQAARAGLEEALSALREDDRRKTEFLAILSHELRNSLAPLRTALALIGREPAPSEAARAALEIGARQVGKLARLVDELLEISRITRGVVELRPETVELGRLAREVADTSRPGFEERGQRLELALPAQPVTVTGDPLRLSQVLENLLSNASKYSDRGTRVELRLGVEGAEARLEVRDEGIGIAPEDQARLFRPFTQLDAALERSHGGLGIGLALVHRFVELHGGRIAVRSAGRDRGTTFDLRLPLAREARAG